MNKIRLYHGTNRNFQEHNLGKARTDLNDRYQGDWICYTDSIDVAWKYSDSARNQNIDNQLFLDELPTVLNQLSDDSVAIKFIESLTHHIIENEYTIAWSKAFDDFKSIPSNELINRTESLFLSIATTKEHSNLIDINDYCDLLENLEHRFKSDEIDSSEQLINLFNCHINEISQDAIDFMKRLGFKDSVPESKLYISEISYQNKLETSDKNEAKSARKNGFDLVLYSGEGTVDDIPEYLIANSSQIKILRVVNKIKPAHKKIKPR